MEENKLKVALAFVIGIIITLIGINFLSNTFNPFVTTHLCPRTGGMMGGYGGGYGPGFGMFFGGLFNLVFIAAIVFVIYYLVTKDDKTTKKKR